MKTTFYIDVQQSLNLKSINTIIESTPDIVLGVVPNLKVTVKMD